MRSAAGAESRRALLPLRPHPLAPLDNSPSPPHTHAHDAPLHPSPLLRAHYLWAPSLFGPGNPAASALVKASPKIAAIIANVAALPGVVAWEAGREARKEPF